jgi:hypothetical protein
MSEIMLAEPVELTDADLDAVSAAGILSGLGGLIGIDVTVKNVLNGNTVQVPIGVAIGILGVAGNFLGARN